MLLFPSLALVLFLTPCCGEQPEDTLSNLPADRPFSAASDGMESAALPKPLWSGFVGFSSWADEWRLRREPDGFERACKVIFRNTDAATVEVEVRQRGGFGEHQHLVAETTPLLPTAACKEAGRSDSFWVGFWDSEQQLPCVARWTIGTRWGVDGEIDCQLAPGSVVGLADWVDEPSSRPIVGMAIDPETGQLLVLERAFAGDTPGLSALAIYDVSDARAVAEDGKRNLQAFRAVMVTSRECAQLAEMHQLEMGVTNRGTSVAVLSEWPAGTPALPQHFLVFRSRFAGRIHLGESESLDRDAFDAAFPGNGWIFEYEMADR